MNPKLHKEIQDYNSKSDYKIKYREIAKGYSLYLEIRKKNYRNTINLEKFTITGLVSRLTDDKLILKKANKIQQDYNAELNNIFHCI